MFIKVKCIVIPETLIDTVRDIGVEFFSTQNTYINVDNILTITSLENDTTLSDRGLLTSITLVNSDYVLVENPIGEVLKQLRL